MVRESDEGGSARRRLPETSIDEPYDDERDHTRCPDCKGSGYYTGFTERKRCPTCEGSGWM